MSRRSAIMMILSLGIGTFLVALPTWVTGSTPSVLGPLEHLDVTGSAAAPGVTAAGLAFLAAGIATGLVGRVGRWVVLGVVGIASLIVVGSSITVVRDPQGPLLSAAASRTGIAQLAEGPHLSVWPWVGIGLGAVSLLLTAWLVRSSGTWLATSRRHERGGTVAPEFLSSSDQGPSPREVESPETIGGAGPHEPPKPPADPTDLWDAQTRGDVDE